MDQKNSKEDLDREAVLRRVGRWTFVRIRGSLFFRDETRALEPVYRRLEELGIGPSLVPGAKSTTPIRDELAERVIRRAQELRTLWSPNETAS